MEGKRTGDKMAQPGQLKEKKIYNFKVAVSGEGCCIHAVVFACCKFALFIFT